MLVGLLHTSCPLKHVSYAKDGDCTILVGILFSHCFSTETRFTEPCFNLLCILAQNLFKPVLQVGEECLDVRSSFCAVCFFEDDRNEKIG